MSGDKMFIKTMVGPIEVDELGIVLPHEHLSGDFRKALQIYPDNQARKVHKVMKMEYLRHMKEVPYGSPCNLVFDHTVKDSIIESLKEFRKRFGGVIVESSSHGMMSPTSSDELYELYCNCHVHIVRGTGFLTIDPSSDFLRPSYYLSRSKEMYYDTMMKDLLEGPFGFIGKVGYTELSFDARVSVLATGEVQESLQCPVQFFAQKRSWDGNEIPSEMLRTYQESGGDIEKAVLLHMERFFKTKETLLEFCDDHKCYYLFDDFGNEFCNDVNEEEDYQLCDIEKFELMEELKNDGKLNRILMSHGIDTRVRLTKYGGHGYTHIQRKCMKIMRRRGFTVDDIKIITEVNPIEWLSMPADNPCFNPT